MRLKVMPKFQKYLGAVFVFILLFQLSESITCCHNTVNESKCARKCTGERCLKLLSPEGRVIRNCISSNDPEYNFVGHSHNEDGEDAYICNNTNHCNSASKNQFIFGALIPPFLINLLTYFLL